MEILTAMSIVPGFLKGKFAIGVVGAGLIGQLGAHTDAIKNSELLADLNLRFMPAANDVMDMTVPQMPENVAVVFEEVDSVAEVAPVEVESKPVVEVVKPVEETSPTASINAANDPVFEQSNEIVGSIPPTLTFDQLNMAYAVPFEIVPQLQTLPMDLAVNIPQSIATKAFTLTLTTDVKGSCRPFQGEREFYERIYATDSSSTEAIAQVYEVSRQMFPFAYSQKDVVAGDDARVTELQKMLMRVNCYSASGRQDDGDMGPNTQNAIQSFVAAHGANYYGLMDSLVYGEGFDPETGESRGRQLLGVKPLFMETLALMAAQNMIYKARVITQANEGQNPFSRDLAMYMEMRGDFLGSENPNYTPLKITENDIDVMARTAFGEARGESTTGRAAVMFAILNRTMTRLLDDNVLPAQFKRTIAETCKAGIPGRKQFSTWNTQDANYELIQALSENSPGENNRIFKELKELARNVLAGRVENPVGGADHYHTSAVNPNWSRTWKVDVKIGTHKFYDWNPQVDRMNNAVKKFSPIFAKFDAIYDRVDSTMTASVPTNTAIAVPVYSGPR